MGEELRAAIVEVLQQRLSDDAPDYWPDLGSWAADLLPVVADISGRCTAAELRAAAAVVRNEHGRASLAAKKIDAHADRLEGK